MAAWRYEFYFLVAKTIFYSLAALVRKILICHSKIFSSPCNILYISYTLMLVCYRYDKDKLQCRVVESSIKLTQGQREYWFQFCNFLVRFSVYSVCPSVWSCSNFKLHQMLEVKNSFKQENIMLQLTFNPGLTLTGFRTTGPRRLQFRPKYLSQCHRSKDKIPELQLKRFVCKLLRFLLRRRFCRQNWYYVAQLYTSSISRYFYNHAGLKKPERENLEVEQACGPVSGPCKPVFRVFTACKQMKNRGTKCAFILVAIRPTVVQSSFHTEFRAYLIDIFDTR